MCCLYLSNYWDVVYLNLLLVFPLCRQVLDQDNFSPIPVSTEEEYRHYTSQFPLQDPELEKVACQREVKSILWGWCFSFSTTWCSIWALWALSINDCVWIKSWLSSLSCSFPSPRSFPFLSLCQKSTANSRSSSMLVWNTPKTYTSGTPAPRRSAFGFNLLIQVHVQWVMKFQTFWSSCCYVLLYPCSPNTDFSHSL